MWRAVTYVPPSMRPEEASAMLTEVSLALFSLRGYPPAAAEASEEPADEDTTVCDGADWLVTAGCSPALLVHAEPGRRTGESLDDASADRHGRDGGDADGRGRSRRPGRRPGHGSGYGARGPWGRDGGMALPFLIRSANLTPEQETKVRAILSAHRTATRNTLEQLRRAQDELADKLLAARPIQTADLQPQLQQIGQLREQLLQR